MCPIIKIQFLMNSRKLDGRTFYSALYLKGRFCTLNRPTFMAAKLLFRSASARGNFSSGFFLQASEVAALIKFKSRLFEAEYNSGNRSECFTLAVDVVRSMVAEKKVEAAVEFCDRFIPPAMANHDFIPYDVLAVYAEILLDAKQPERVTEFLLGFGLMQMKGPPSGSFLITDALEVMMPYCDNLALAAAACIVMLGFDNFKSIEGLLTGRILVAASFT